MTARASRPESVTFDNTDPELIHDLYARVAEVQARCPVAWTAASGGFWMLTKYDDIVEASRDWQTNTVTQGDHDPADRRQHAGHTGRARSAAPQQVAQARAAELHREGAPAVGPGRAEDHR